MIESYMGKLKLHQSANTFHSNHLINLVSNIKPNISYTAKSLLWPIIVRKDKAKRGNKKER